MVSLQRKSDLINLIEKGVEDGVGPVVQEFIPAWDELSDREKRFVEVILRGLLTDYVDEVGEAQQETPAFDDALQCYTTAGALAGVTRSIPLVEAVQETTRRLANDLAEREIEKPVLDPISLVRDLIAQAA